jgi:hypothetical protein
MLAPHWCGRTALGVRAPFLLGALILAARIAAEAAPSTRDA